MAESDENRAILAKAMSAAKWDHWANLATVEFLDACILSMGREPSFIRPHLMIKDSERRLPPGLAVPEWLQFDKEVFRRRAEIVRSHLGKALPAYSTEGDGRDFNVRLTEFRAWGEALPVPFNFPDDFPGVRAVPQDTIEPANKKTPASGMDIPGTKLIGRTEIMLGYDDFVRLFSVTDPRNLAPGLVVRTDGVYVIPPSDDIDLTPEERATLTDHPTGNLSEPALPLQCPLARLEAFADRYGLGCAIDPFVMMTVVNKLTWAYAQVEHQTAQGFIRDFLPGLMRLRGELHRQHEVETNDSKKVVQRALLDKLNLLLAPIDNADGDFDAEPSSATGVAGKWPWGDHETGLLRKLAAAAEKYWKLYDPTDTTTAPTNQAIVEWLKEQGVTANIAQAMATILRVDGLSTGPRR